MKLILASGSPRRKEILNYLNIPFEVIISSFEEKIDEKKPLEEEIKRLSEGKASTVFKDNKDAIVIGADTIVTINNKVLGKPKDKEEAYKMLKALSNKEHFVVTSICAIETPNMRKKIHSTTSYVSFNELSDSMIHNYIIDFNPLDKAGSYGIQELPQSFVKNIGGSFENIIGLSPESVTAVLQQLEYRH